MDDIVFGEGEIQNFIVEFGVGSSHPPKDILTESNSGRGVMCLETPLITIPTPPSVVLLSDNKLAKRISDTFYLKL